MKCKIFLSEEIFLSKRTRKIYYRIIFIYMLYTITTFQFNVAVDYCYTINIDIAKKKKLKVIQLHSYQTSKLSIKLFWNTNNNLYFGINGYNITLVIIISLNFLSAGFSFSSVQSKLPPNRDNDLIKYTFIFTGIRTCRVLPTVETRGKRKIK